MHKVAIYVRSSKDLHDVSCEAQESQLSELVKRNGESIYRVFRDKALSSTRDVRPEFDEMISMAMSKNPPFNKIYCLDTSRFGRDELDAKLMLHELRRKHGIEVVFANMPTTGTFLSPIFFLREFLFKIDKCQSSCQPEMQSKTKKRNKKNHP